MENYNPEELLIVLSLCSEESPKDDVDAKEAFYKIVEIYKVPLIKYCISKLYTQYKSSENVVFDSSDAETLVWNTFFTLKDKAGNFDLKKANTPNIENAVFAYLVGILRKEFLKFYFKKEFAEIELPEYTIDVSESGDLVPKRKIAIGLSVEAIEILQGMNVKMREVFLATEEFKDFGKYIPREIKQLLCEKLDLAPDSITTYRKRAKEYLAKRFNVL